MLNKNLFINAGACMFLALASSSYAATLVEVWDTPDRLPILDNFHFVVPGNQPSNYFIGKNQQANNIHQFKLFRETSLSDTTHTRYTQYYQNTPLYGTQVIVHNNEKIKITGVVVKDIEQDINSMQPAISADNAVELSLENLKKQNPEHDISKPRTPQTYLTIFIDKETADAKTGVAKLAYHVSFFAENASTNNLLYPITLVDAKTGEVLFNYDNVQTNDHHKAVGTGPGGNDIASYKKLGFRKTNHYRFGNEQDKNLFRRPALGSLPVKVDLLRQTCTMETDHISVTGFNNVSISVVAGFLPVFINEQDLYLPFSYHCNGLFNFKNWNDNGYAPLFNFGFEAYSPHNDVFYFANETYRMLQKYLADIKYPLGKALPIHIYDHIGQFDNAAALLPSDPPEPRHSAAPLFNPQLIIGNGFTQFYPLTASEIIAHELGHVFTYNHAFLIYADQSGGINEAYSDMTGVTFNDFLNQQFPWYGFSWDISATVLLPPPINTQFALRYMNNPPLDEHSIDNAANFVPGMNVHYSSGVFNKAFYLMVSKYKIKINTAFQYMSAANAEYWIPLSTFNQASCGVIQAALDAGSTKDANNIAKAFADVGVFCGVNVK